MWDIGKGGALAIAGIAKTCSICAAVLSFIIYMYSLVSRRFLMPPDYLTDALGSIKPSACTGRCPGPQGWQDLDPLSNTLVLKRGLHLRTHIPGITEIQLYRWLLQDVQSTQPMLQQVVLWPGVDRYDLLLRFQDGTWAVDVKDYKDPFALGKHIAQDNRHFAENELIWNYWFYVYPSYREISRSDYATHVRRA